MLNRSPFFTATLLFSMLVAPSVRADGPGLPNLTYPANEVNTVIGRIGADIGAPRGHGTLSMHRGYVAVVFSLDSGKGDGGFAFYDISNPKMPVLVNSKDDDETQDIREAHGYGFWGDYVVLQSGKGVQFWDWSDVMNPKRVSALDLPGVSASDYLVGAWWAFWQAPYVYVGGSQNGLFIIDASDVANPKLVDRGPDRPNPIPTSNLGGFRIGPIFALGNLLVVSGMDDPGYATLDIRDPKNPLLLATKRLGMPKVYSAMLNGGKIYGPGDDGALHVHDVSDPFQIVDLGKSEPMGGKGGYTSIQDGFAHVGASSNYAKVDITAASPYPVPVKVSQGTAGDRDFGTALGNLVVISDDHDNGSFLVPHQSAPDTTPPAVNFQSPKNGATNVALTSRIGLSFTDQIDRRTANSSTFIVRPVGGQALAGRYSYQTNLLNFAPDEDLLPNTTYEIVLPSGGLKDLAQNGVAETFISSFSTGVKVDNPACTVTSSGPAVHGTDVTFSVNAAGMGPVTYAWDFGDGTPLMMPSAVNSAQHKFDKPGHYTVNVLVRNATDVIAACSLQQTAHRQLTTNRPNRSSTVILDESAGKVWVANLDSGSVSAFSIDPLAKLFEVNVGAHPRALAKAADGSIWVVVEKDARIAILSEKDGQEIASISLPLGSLPTGIVMHPDGTRAYVSLRATGHIVALDTAKRTITQTIAVGPTPRGLAISGDGKNLLATRFLSTDEQAEVFEIDTESFAVGRTLVLAPETTPDTESSGSGLYNYLRSVTISPDGLYAWIPAKKDNIGRGAWQSGQPLTFENSVRSIVTALDLSTGQETTSLRLDFNDRSLPSVAEMSPLGDYVFVATEGTNTVEVIDAYNPHSVGGVENVGKAPDGLALRSDGKMLYVHSFLSRSLHAIDVSGLLAGTSTQVAQVAEVATIEKEPLAANVLLGKQIFYDASDRRMSRDKYISCAVCHLDGEHDGRTWDFTDRGEGLRNTTTLLGKRGAGQGRLHWTANFDEVQDFEHDIRNAFGGQGFLTDEVFHSNDHDQTLGGKKAGLSPELDALDAYLVSLSEVPRSPFRKADGSLTDDGVLGQAIFSRLGCNECHVGADLTDSSKNVLHDVGTIFPQSGERLGMALTGFDTPTLQGIWATAPYLHDGSAKTLDDVFEQAAQTGGKHGEIGSLSAAERKQLVAFLLAQDGTPPEEAAGCTCRIVGMDMNSRGINGVATAFLGLGALVLRRRRSFNTKTSRKGT